MSNFPPVKFETSHRFQYRRDNPECVQTVTARDARELTASSRVPSPFFFKEIVTGEFMQTPRWVFVGAPTEWAQERGATHILAKPLSLSEFKEHLANPGGLHPYHMFFTPIRFNGRRMEALRESEDGESFKWEQIQYRSK